MIKKLPATCNVEQGFAKTKETNQTILSRPKSTRKHEEEEE